jgi:peroxiredoxin
MRLNYDWKFEEVSMLKEGTKAPDFSLKDDEGRTITLTQFSGKKVVLYFYPKDDTPGCTTEACALRDVYDTILEKGAVVLGVSADSESSHSKFKKKYKLPFFLVSDPEKNRNRSLRRFRRKVFIRKNDNGNQAVDVRNRRKGNDNKSISQRQTGQTRG